MVRSMDAPEIDAIADLYERDFLRWLEAQAMALRAGGTLDRLHLAEEIEGLARKERDELRRRITTLVEHLLKLEHSRNERPRRGWEATIAEQRRALADLLTESPSLRRLLPATLARAWPDACGRVEGSFAKHEPGVELDLPTQPTMGIEDVLG